MTTTYCGEVSLGVALPLPVALVFAAQAELQAKVDATIAMRLNVQIPTTLLDLLALVNQMLSALEAMLQRGLEPPTISAQLSIISSALALLELQLQPFLAFGNLMAAAGVFIYAYDGATNAAGGELTTALSGGFPGHGATVHANILMLGCVAGATWSAIQAVMKTTP